MNLLDYLGHVTDPRRKQGQRYKFSTLLIFILMSMLCGKYQYREIARFCRNNEKYLRNRFGIKAKNLPSHVTIRALVKALDFESLQKSFHQWTKNYVEIEAGDWISVDGKAITSTVSDYSTSYQNFVSLVSLFSQKREQVLHVERLENKKSNEGKVVEELLSKLDLQGVIFTFDALHCKKNSTKNRRKQESLCCQSESQSTQTAQSHEGNS